LAGKKDRKNPFQNNPFKNLKGFSVSTPPREAPPTERGKAPPAEVEDGEDEGLFSGEMGRLGVRKISGEKEGEEAGPSEPESQSPEERPVEKVLPTATDEDLFLDALGRMDVSFEDEIPHSELPSPRPRRMKQLRQGKRVPEGTLDLHGCTRAEAREKVRFFLEDALFQGKKTVLVITGRGRGSAVEPVLRSEIERYLSREAGALVSEWGRAPGRYGGEGALVVFLKRGSEK
jgi:DNA-nicking Smr family endonuclease